MNSEIRHLAQHPLHAGVNPLCERDRRLIQRVASSVQVSRDADAAIEDRSTVGERLADRVAASGGSWAFIVGFGAVLAAWALLNVAVLAGSAFDPRSFVVLNLLLSMLAALLATLIMISRNRRAPKDRPAIADLHDKVDRMQAQIEQLVALRHAVLRPGDATEARPSLRAA